MIPIEKIQHLFENTSILFKDFILEKESQEYDACHFKLNEIRVQYRKAKITPKKEGQFVTFWKRIPSGIIAPFEEADPFDYLIVAVETENESGYFIFAKAVLASKRIITTKLKEGKRAFRIYPPWSNPKNKQAIDSQKWQSACYVEKSNFVHFFIKKSISQPIKTT